MSAENDVTNPQQNSNFHAPLNVAAAEFVPVTTNSGAVPKKTYKQNPHPNRHNRGEGQNRFNGNFNGPPSRAPRYHQRYDNENSREHNSRNLNCNENENYHPDRRRNNVRNNRPRKIENPTRSSCDPNPEDAINDVDSSETKTKHHQNRPQQSHRNSSNRSSSGNQTRHQNSSHTNQNHNASRPSQNKIKTPRIDPAKISQRDQLIRDIETGKIECMICCERIRDHHSIWNCSNCFRIQHLHCIRTWIKNSKSETHEWRCVACQFERKEIPKDYFCFCGQIKSPPLSRDDLAHSCGSMCAKTDNCPHPCSLQCHPGPHAICQAFVERSCGCGKLKKTYQCCQKEVFECEAVCGKTLSCGVHECRKKCHQGDCSECDFEIDMKCFCNKHSKTETCSPDNAMITRYSCSQICDLPLNCGNHNCKSTCHSGNCDSCQLSPELVENCPCGRMKIAQNSRKTCVDEIPVCDEVCGKSLPCAHTCEMLCHLDACPPCDKTKNIKCRCGRIEEKIECKLLESTDLRCKKKCTKFKTCGKHRCNQQCCIELEHVCQSSCGKMLSCGKHRCQRNCHIGNCSSCTRVSFDELRCECGASVVYPPVPCGVPVPECKNKCTRRHKCDHPISHHCHSGTECPPCVFLTAKWCFGLHEQRKTIPCNQKSFSCGLNCRKPLKCGNHFCLKTCHEGFCETANEKCKQPCTKKRNECEHNCNAPCHTDKCPDTTCRVSIEVTCECGNLKSMKSCEQVAYENRKLQRVKLAMQVQEGGGFEMIDITTIKKTTKTLTCNDECKTLERNRRLDIAFKIDNPSLASSYKFMPSYSDFVKTFYKKDSTFVDMVFEKLTSLVKLTKESKQQPRSFSFPCMNRDKRHLVHDLAAMFGCETQAYDAEPNRNIVATASKIACWLPSHTISEVLARENGQRQVRPPSNAWSNQLKI